MNRRSLGVVLVLLVSFLHAPAVLAGDTDAHFTDEQLNDFLREHLSYREGTIAFERDGTFYVELSNLNRDLPVQVYRRTIRKTNGNKKLVERSLGTATLAVEGPDLARLVPDTSAAENIGLGDQVRTRPLNLDLVLRGDRDLERLRNLLLDQPGIGGVRVVENRGEARVPYLDLGPTRARLFLETDRRPTATLKPEMDRSSTRRARGQLRDRASFDRTVNDFEWIRLPTRSPIHLIALGSEGSIGFARFEEKVTGIHWLEVPGTVLDLSIRRVSSENPGKIYFLAVLKQNDVIRTRSYSFNALDRSLIRQWSARDLWIRSATDGRYYAQEIGLNVPFSRTLRRVKVNDKGWTVVSDEELTFKETVISPAYASRPSAFAYLDDSGRLHLRQNKGPVRTLAPKFGGDPRSVSARRNDRGKPLQPEFALNTRGDSLYLFLPRNISGGFTFLRGLRSYNQSRLFFLKAGASSVRTVWESNLQSGYVSATDHFEKSHWAMVVDPTAERSTLKELRFQSSPDSGSRVK